MGEPRAYSICLLTYNRQTVLAARWKELARLYARRTDVELCVLDNGSTDGTSQTIAAWRILTMPIDARQGGWKLVSERLENNVGFGPGFNLLVSLSTARVVILLSDDVEVRGGFVDPMGAKLAEVGPKAIVGQALVNHEAGWNQFGSKCPIPYLYGHILAMRREAWDEIGGFDPLFVPAGYEDVDLSYKAANAGYQLVEMRNLPVLHMSLSAERYEHTVGMKALFAKKWHLENVPERP